MQNCATPEDNETTRKMSSKRTTEDIPRESPMLSPKRTTTSFPKYTLKDIPKAKKSLNQNRYLKNQRQTHPQRHSARFKRQTQRRPEDIFEPKDITKTTAKTQKHSPRTSPKTIPKGTRNVFEKPTTRKKLHKPRTLDHFEQGRRGARRKQSRARDRWDWSTVFLCPFCLCPGPASCGAPPKTYSRAQLSEMLLRKTIPESDGCRVAAKCPPQFKGKCIPIYKHTKPPQWAQAKTPCSKL